MVGIDSILSSVVQANWSNLSADFNKLITGNLSLFNLKDALKSVGIDRKSSVANGKNSIRSKSTERTPNGKHRKRD